MKTINWNEELNEARKKLCQTHLEIEAQNKRIEALDDRVKKINKEASDSLYILGLWENYFKLKTT